MLLNVVEELGIVNMYLLEEQLYTTCIFQYNIIIMITMLYIVKIMYN